jgi:hypothetical protein
MTKTMRALVGGVAPDWEVRDVEVPTPGPQQILVRVRAAARSARSRPTRSSTIATRSRHLRRWAGLTRRRCRSGWRPFDDAQSAAERLRANQAVGKLVLELAR